MTHTLIITNFEKVKDGILSESQRWEIHVIFIRWVVLSLSLEKRTLSDGRGVSGGCWWSGRQGGQGQNILRQEEDGCALEPVGVLEWGGFEDVGLMGRMPPMGLVHLGIENQLSLVFLPWW